MTEEFFGENGARAQITFQERALYKEYAMETYDNLNLTDFLYNNPLYGRVDTKGFSITPKEEFLAQFVSTETVFAPDTVVDIFEKFQSSYILELYGRFGIQNLDSHYVNFVPMRAYTSIEPIYFSYLKGIFDAFLEELTIDLSLRRKLCNFDKFLGHYFYFMNNVAKQFPVTKTAFVRSNLCPPTVSGLVIDLKKALDSGDDFLKKTDFIDDNLFDAFVRYAAGWGFSIDKNIPWRLVARPGSTQFKRSFEDDEDLDIENFFKRNYNRVYEQEYYNFKIMAEQFYNSFVLAYPEENYATYSGDAIPQHTFYQRSSITSADISVKGEKYWLEKYYKLRMLELGKDISARKVKKTLINFHTFRKAKGLENMLFRMEKRFIKLDKLAFPEKRKKHFDYGSFSSVTGIYAGKKKVLKEISPLISKVETISEDSGQNSGKPGSTY